MAENLLKVMYVLEGLQQAELLRMLNVLNVYRRQSPEIGDPGDSAPTAQFDALQHLAFPKTKITFEMEKISDRH